jgi:effector-binding domain-containing protein
MINPNIDKLYVSDVPANIIEIRDMINSKEIIRIGPDGRLFWNQREVTTDDDFRQAMLELVTIWKKTHQLWNTNEYRTTAI